jgi:hypothetical protein
MDKKNSNGKFSKNKMLRSGVIFKNTLKNRIKKGGDLLNHLLL